MRNIYFCHSNVSRTLVSMGPILWALTHLPLAIFGHVASLFSYIKLRQRTQREEDALERMFKASSLANFFSFFAYSVYGIYCIATFDFILSVSFNQDFAVLPV